MSWSARLISLFLLTLFLASPVFAGGFDDDHGIVSELRPGGRPGGGFPGGRPIPRPVPRPIPVPRPNPRPYPVPVPTPFPIPVPAPVPVPVPVPAPQPTQYQCYAEPVNGGQQWSGGMSVDLNAASANAVQICQQQSGQACQAVRCEQY